MKFVKIVLNWTCPELVIRKCRQSGGKGGFVPQLPCLRECKNLQIFVKRKKVMTSSMDCPLKQTMKFETISSIQKYRKYCAKSTTPPPSNE